MHLAGCSSSVPCCLGHALRMLTRALAGCAPPAGDGVQEHQEALLPLVQKKKKRCMGISK